MSVFIAITPTDLVKVSPESVYTWPTPAGLCTDLSALFTWSAIQFDETTIILPVDPTGLGRDAVADVIKTLGWTTTSTDGGWFTCTSTEVPAKIIHLGIVEWLRDDPVIQANTAFATPLYIATRLYEWWRLTGSHYRYTPGVAALVTMRTISRLHSPRWTVRDHRDGAWWKPPAGSNAIRDIRIDIPARARKLFQGKEIHKWDMRSAYLAGAAAVELPYRQLVQTNDPGQVGYYRIITNTHTTALTRYLGPAERGGYRWITHPMYNYLIETGQPFNIVDSWTTPAGSTRIEHGRILRPWAEKWRDAINTPDATGIGTTLKHGYVQAIGLLNVPRGSVYRPDWRHMIIDQVRVSMLRRIARVEQLLGILPLQIQVDAVYYAYDPTQATTTPPGAARFRWIDQVGEALGLGHQIGRMRYEGAS